MARRTGSAAAPAAPVSPARVDPLQGLAKHLAAYRTAVRALTELEPTKSSVVASVREVFRTNKIAVDASKTHKPTPHALLRLAELEAEIENIRPFATDYLNEELKKRNAENGPTILTLRAARTESLLKYRNGRTFLDELGLLVHSHDVTAREDGTTVPCPKDCPVVTFPPIGGRAADVVSVVRTRTAGIKIGHMIFSIDGRDRADNFDLSRFAWFATDGINGPKTRLTATEFRALVRDRTGNPDLNPDTQPWTITVTIQATGKSKTLTARLREVAVGAGS